MDKSDEELVAGYLAGDEACFAALAKRHLAAVYSLAARMAGRSHADDIAQEVFIKAWKNLSKFRPDVSKFKTWLMRIARNATVDVLRKKKIPVFSDFENGGQESSFAEDLRDQGPLADEVLAAAGDNAELAAAIQKLSPAHREIVLLYYYNDYTFGELGAMLNAPQNTIKSRHRRALQTLREALAPKTI